VRGIRELHRAIPIIDGGERGFVFGAEFQQDVEDVFPLLHVGVREPRIVKGQDYEVGRFDGFDCFLPHLGEAEHREIPHRMLEHEIFPELVGKLIIKSLGAFARRQILIDRHGVKS